MNDLLILPVVVTNPQTDGQYFKLADFGDTDNGWGGNYIMHTRRSVNVQHRLTLDSKRTIATRAPNTRRSWISIITIKSAMSTMRRYSCPGRYSH
jgi:hypothetical protein